MSQGCKSLVSECPQSWSYIFDLIQEIVHSVLGMVDSRHHGLMVRRCFPVAKIVGSSPTGVVVWSPFAFCVS
jgi:hypothetical protein